MQIQIKKNLGKLHIIKYIRDNGTETWMQADDFFVRHDLSHYALESIMQYKTAFNGMLNSGMEIRDFEDKEKRALLNITAEAWYAENMANLFLIEISQGEFLDFNTIQQQAFISFNNRFPAILLPEEKITATRNYLRHLLQQWAEMPVGQTLALTFDT